MMKTKFHVSIIGNASFLFLLVGILLVGCKKFVEIGPPNTQLATTSVFNTSVAATAAQNAIYIKMWAESYNMAAACGLLSDELVNYSTSAPFLQYYSNSMSALTTLGPWNNAYIYIYYANSIIAGLQNNGNIAAPIAAQLTGESKFIRAFWHFYLVNLYGDVPLVLTPDYTKNGSIGRTPQALVYQQIIADLKDAQGYLNSNYVDASDTAITTERVRPTKAAAAALLARVYLFTQKYDSAEMYADLVINNGSMYSLCPNLIGTANAVFLRNSTEAIWQLATPSPSSYFTPDGQFFFLKGAPSTSGSGINCTAINQNFLPNSFEPNDKRKAQWIAVYPTSGTGTKYYFPNKYQSNNTATTASNANVTEYVMVLRLGEQYLIRSEARAQQNKISDAIGDLNVIRNRAGLPNYAGPTDQASVLRAILHERQVELFAEWGHRWFDLKRTGSIDAVMGGVNGVCQAKGGTWNTYDQLMPIAQTQLIGDPHLVQNPGY